MANRLTKVLDYLGLNRKSDVPDFGRGTWLSTADNFRFTGWGWNKDRWGIGIDYVKEAGPLENSSLVMAVCNDTGISLAEARPAVRVKDKNGEMQPDPNHPCSELIRRPNPFYIWADYCLAGSVSWWIDGNWYMKKVHDATGQVVQLWYLPHFMVEPRWLGDGRTPEVPAYENGQPSDPFLSHYQYLVPGKPPVLIPARDMVHIKRGVNLANPRRGIGAFDSVVKEIYGDNKAALFAATILKNMGIVVPILSPKDKDITVNETQAQEIKERWTQGTTGDNVGKPMVNSIAMDVTKFAFSPQELDLKALRLVPESRIAAVTRYPASYLQFLVGLEFGTSYASYKEAREQAYESVIIPIQTSIGEQLTWQLLPEFEKQKGAYFFFDTGNVRVLQDDQDNLMKRATMGFLGGVLMRSDSRNMLKLPTKPEDDVFFEPRSSGLLKEGEDPNAVTGSSTGAQPLRLVKPAKGFGSVAEIDAYLGSLERQMKEFSPQVETSNKEETK